MGNDFHDRYPPIWWCEWRTWWNAAWRLPFPWRFDFQWPSKRVRRGETWNLSRSTAANYLMNSRNRPVNLSTGPDQSQSNCLYVWIGSDHYYLPSIIRPVNIHMLHRCRAMCFYWSMRIYLSVFFIYLHIFFLSIDLVVDWKISWLLIGFRKSFQLWNRSKRLRNIRTATLILCWLHIVSGYDIWFTGNNWEADLIGLLDWIAHRQGQYSRVEYWLSCCQYF